MTTLIMSDKYASTSLGSIVDLGVQDASLVLPDFMSFVAQHSHCAYSVTKLNAAYSGPCLRVIVGSTETDIGFTAGGDLDQTALAAAAGSGTAYVVKWYDQSGLGRHAVPVTLATPPTIVSSGVILTNIANGLPVIRTATAATARILKAPADVTSTIQPVAVSAYKGITLGAGSIACALGNLENGSQFSGILVGSLATAVYQSVVRTGNVNYGTGNSGTWTNSNLDISHCDAGTLRRYLNGSAAGTASVTYALHDTTGVTIGGPRSADTAANYATIDHQAALVVNLALSQTDAKAISTALNVKLRYY